MAKKSGEKNLRRWVIKAGSAMVCTGGPILLRSWMQQVVILKKNHNIEVIWVTSGAISSAVDRVGIIKSRNKWDLSEKQALSAMGQPILMDLYNLALHSTGLMGAQVLLTYTDLADKKRRNNFQQTVEQLLNWKVVPILNENDAVATEEIKFGDNDSLSAKVAVAMAAERLIILTDVEGLFDKDPKKYVGANLVQRIATVTPKLLSSVGSHSGSQQGTGGMYSKLKAAKEASSRGVETLLVKGDASSVLIKIAENNFLGTTIQAKRK